MASTRLDLSFGIARDLGTILVQMVREFLLRQMNIRKPADFDFLSPLVFQGQDTANPHAVIRGTSVNGPTPLIIRIAIRVRHCFILRHCICEYSVFPVFRQE